VKEICEVLEFKMLYELQYMSAAEIFELIDITSYRDNFSKDFYVQMFQHLVSVLDRSQVEQVNLCMGIFAYDQMVRENIQKFPEFKQYISQHVLQLNQEDLCSLFRLYSSDKKFGRRITSVFIERLQKDGELFDATDNIVLFIMRNALRHPDLRD
jgi:hypothetical protein